MNKEVATCRPLLQAFKEALDHAHLCEADVRAEPHSVKQTLGLNHTAMSGCEGGRVTLPSRNHVCMSGRNDPFWPLSHGMHMKPCATRQLQTRSSAALMQARGAP